MKRGIIIILIGVQGTLLAQNNVFTLQQCIDTALQNNLQVNQTMYQMQSDEVAKNQAKLNRLPSIYGNGNHSLSQGRSIDPATNIYATQKFGSGNYSVTGEVVLFHGLSLQNLMRQSAMNYEASKMDWQQQKDNITLNVILAYLQILNNQDQLVQAKSQADISAKQAERLKIMDEKGAIPPSDLYDVKGQYANDKIAVVTAIQNLETAKITLCGLMNIPYIKEIRFVQMPVDTMLSYIVPDPAKAYRTALENFASVKASAFRVKTAALGVKVAKGNLFPTLSLGSGLNSNYSSTNNFSYGKQLDNNLSSSVGLFLSVPIFNSLKRRNEIKLATIDYKNFAVQDNAERIALQRNIEQSYVNLQSAFEQYKLLTEQVAALQNSFMAAEAKFTAGVGTSIDYITVKTKLDNANVNLISGKYAYVLRMKIFNYFQGKITVE